MPASVARSSGGGAKGKRSGGARLSKPVTSKPLVVQQRRGQGADLAQAENGDLLQQAIASTSSDLELMPWASGSARE